MTIGDQDPPVDRMALWELAEWRAHRTPDAVFAVDEDGQELTFAGYLDSCGQVAAGLHRLGVGRDDPVAWMLPTWIETLVLAGALARLGAVQVPLIPILRDREASFILGQTGARLLVVPGVWRRFDYPAMAGRLARSAGPLVQVMVVDRVLPSGDPSDLPPWSTIRPDPSDDPVRWIFYTSGTTADPKGTLHTDRTVAAIAHRLNLRFEMTAADRNGLVFPVTHIGGISWLMGGLMAGYRHIMIEVFQPEASCEVLRRHGVTIAGSGPAFWMAFVAEQRRHPEAKAFPSLRALVGGGAAKPPTIDAEVRDVLGVVLATGYGSSECPGLAHSGASDSEEVRQTDGYALEDVEIRIVGPDGTSLPPGVPGEIVVKGPMLFKGYLHPDDNVGIFDARGGFRTGDVGTLDEHGLLRVTGRLKDIIIRHGENISAKEVEDVLYLHPAVVDAAAIAVPDPARGELCCAVVVLAPGCSSLSLDEIAEHCRRQGLARHKTPERLEIATELPRNSTGKVLKTQLVEALLV
jgi:acyl-CoA synthetase (AMP-forming)/AMP-acid ligase II